MEQWTCGCGEVNEGPGPCGRCLAPAPPAGDLLPALPSPSRNRPLIIVTAGVAVFLLLVGIAVLLARSGGDGDDGDGGVQTAQSVLVSPTTTASPATSSTPTDPPTTIATENTDTLAPLVAELQRFVEESRGLKFKQPVKVTLLPVDQFRDRMREQSKRDAEEAQDLRDVGDVLVALGLLDPDVDIEAAVDNLFATAVAGFYDPEKNEMVIRGADVTPYVRVTLVHELVHALQDQHFELHRPDLEDRDDEASTGFSGLVEGDAVRIERMYERTLSAEERRQAQEEERRAAAGIPSDTPRVLLELLGFPYIVGPEFATHVFDAGGQPRLDEAFRAMPTTSEQLIHPERFLAGETTREVTKPTADGEVIDEGVIGEFGLLLMLTRSVEPSEAARAADGWGGDWYRAWKVGEETCLRATIVMDTDRDTAQLLAALEVWADDNGATISGTSPIEVHVCN